MKTGDGPLRQDTSEDKELGDIPRGHEKILLVEDARDVRELAFQLLIRLGYQVIAAASGEEALERFREDREGQIQLLLTDLVMPKMNGNTLEEKLRRIKPI